MSDLSQIEKKLGSFPSDPRTYTKEFKYLTQTYDLTWHDIFVILSSTLSTDENDRIWSAAQAHANEVHLTEQARPIGMEAVPRQDPGWHYQVTPGVRAEGRERRDYMISCLLAGLKRASHLTVNYDKLNQVTQRPGENPAELVGHLTDTLVQYTCLDSNSRQGMVVLNTHFIAQSAPDIKRKLKKLEKGPEAPQR